VLAVHNISPAGPNFFCYELFSSDIYEINTISLFINNRMILEYKVTMLVLKLLNESYIFSVVFVINFSWRKVYFFYIWKPGHAHPTLELVWQKLKISIPNNVWHSLWTELSMAKRATCPSRIHWRVSIETQGWTVTNFDHAFSSVSITRLNIHDDGSLCKYKPLRHLAKGHGTRA